MVLNYLIGHQRDLCGGLGAPSKDFQLLLDDFLGADYTTVVTRSTKDDSVKVQCGSGATLIAALAADKYSVAFCWQYIYLLCQNKSRLRILSKNAVLSADSSYEGVNLSGSWKYVDAGEKFAIAISNDGLGYRILPTEHAFETIPLSVESRINITAVACGSDHFLALSNIGQVYSEGIGSRGQLGHGDMESTSSLKRIEALEMLKVIQIAAGNWHSICLSDTSDVYSWGWNESGQLGVPSSLISRPNSGDDSATSDKLNLSSVHALPVVVDFEEFETDDFQVNIEQVACGSRHTVCLSADRRQVFVFGWNGCGQLGVPNEQCAAVDRPMMLSGLGDLLKLDENEDAHIAHVDCSNWATIVCI